MVKQVLTLAGFTEDKDFKETRFLSPPKTTYAIFLDSYRGYGADGFNLIKSHDYTIELYAYKPDPKAEKRLEDALDALGLEYEKSDRLWLDSEGLYETIYDFNYIEK